MDKIQLFLCTGFSDTAFGSEFSGKADTSLNQMRINHSKRLLDGLPLGLRDTATNRDFQRTKARVWLTPNTCFFANPGLLFANDSVNSRLFHNSKQFKIMKHPLQITKEDLKEIMHIPLQIGVGPANKGEVTETLDGEIIECSLAANPPNLPGIADFQIKNGTIRKFSFFEIKWIHKIQS